MRRLITLSLFTAAVALSGCSSLSPFSDKTKLDLTLVASDDLNPDLAGRPSPIVVRLLELKILVVQQRRFLLPLSASEGIADARSGQLRGAGSAPRRDP